MQSVIIGESVKNLGDDAFRDCKNLKIVELGKNVRHVGFFCFSYGYKGLKIYAPEGLKLYFDNNENITIISFYVPRRER